MGHESTVRKIAESRDVIVARPDLTELVLRVPGGWPATPVAGVRRTRYGRECGRGVGPIASNRPGRPLLSALAAAGPFIEEVAVVQHALKTGPRAFTAAGPSPLVPTKQVVVEGVALRLVPRIDQNLIEVVTDDADRRLIGRVIDIGAVAQVRLWDMTDRLGSQRCRDQIRTAAVAWWQVLVVPKRRCRP